MNATAEAIFVHGSSEPIGPARVSRRNILLAAVAVYGLSLVALIATFLYFIEHMNYIIQRDPSFYWDRSYTLYQTLLNGGLLEWAKVIFFSLSENHTFIPSVIPSLVFWIFSSDRVLVYGLTIIVFYLAPIPAVGALVPAVGQPWWKPVHTVMTGVVLLAGMYPFVIRLFPTMPDFGGNLFVSAAILLGAAALASLSPDRQARSIRWLGAILAGFLFALFLSVVFRRWFAFNAVGLSLAFGTAMLVRASPLGRETVVHVLKAAVLAALVFGLLLSPILLPKVATVSSSGIFAGAYDAYRANYFRTFARFGLTELIVIGVIAALALAVHRRESRALLLFVLAGNVIGILSFLQLQAPGLHHFSLLWPTLLVSVSVVLQRFAAPGPAQGRQAGLIGAAVLASAVVIAVTFPRSPPVESNMAGYRLLGDRIAQHGLVNRRFCVLGSREIYPSVVQNLWQIRGGFREASPAPVRVPEVDFGTADRYVKSGSLVGVLKSCDWIIAQADLRMQFGPQFHRILRFHHEGAFKPDSEIGKHYTIADRFHAGFSSPIVFLKRTPGAGSDPDKLVAEYSAWLEKDKAAFPQ